MTPSNEREGGGMRRAVGWPALIAVLLLLAGAGCSAPAEIVSDDTAPGADPKQGLADGPTDLGPLPQFVENSQGLFVVADKRVDASPVPTSGTVFRYEGQRGWEALNPSGALVSFTVGITESGGPIVLGTKCDDPDAVVRECGSYTAFSETLDLDSGSWTLRTLSSGEEAEWSAAFLGATDAGAVFSVSGRLMALDAQGRLARSIENPLGGGEACANDDGNVVVLGQSMADINSWNTPGHEFPDLSEASVMIFDMMDGSRRELVLQGRDRHRLAQLRAMYCFDGTVVFVTTTGEVSVLDARRSPPFSSHARSVSDLPGPLVGVRTTRISQAEVVATVADSVVWLDAFGGARVHPVPTADGEADRSPYPTFHRLGTYQGSVLVYSYGSETKSARLAELKG